MMIHAHRMCTIRGDVHMVLMLWCWVLNVNSQSYLLVYGERDMLILLCVFIIRIMPCLDVGDAFYSCGNL